MRYNLVHGFCFFKLFLSGGNGLRVQLTACAGGLQTWNPSCWLSL